VRIFGDQVRVRAWIDKVDGFSGHADHLQINRWLGSMTRPPQRTILTHGEPAALEAQRARLSAWPGWSVQVPSYGEEMVLE